jgi:hypothetical protein
MDSFATSEAQSGFSILTTISQTDPRLSAQVLMAAFLASDSLGCCDDLPKAPSRGE